MERVYKRYIPFDNGGGSPDTETLRAAKANIKYHLAYIGWLVRARDWLAGDQLELCRSGGGGASVGRRLSGRCAVGRRRDSEELVRADQIAPVVPRAAGRKTVRPDAVADLRQSRFLTPDALKAALIEAARAHGFDAIGIARPDSIPQAAERLREFLETGAHGDMAWLADQCRAARRARTRCGRRCARSSCSASITDRNGHDADPLGNSQTAQARRHFRLCARRRLSRRDQAAAEEPRPLADRQGRR